MSDQQYMCLGRDNMKLSRPETGPAARHTNIAAPGAGAPRPAYVPKMFSP